MELNINHNLIERSSASWAEGRPGRTVEATTEVMVFTVDGITQNDGSPARIHLERTQVSSEPDRWKLVINDDDLNKQFRKVATGAFDAVEELRNYVADSLIRSILLAKFEAAIDRQGHNRTRDIEVERLGWLMVDQPDLSGEERTITSNPDAEQSELEAEMWEFVKNLEEE